LSSSVACTTAWYYAISDDHLKRFSTNYTVILILILILITFALIVMVVIIAVVIISRLPELDTASQIALRPNAESGNIQLAPHDHDSSFYKQQSRRI